MDAVFHKSADRQFEEIVVFVHHFGGSAESTRKHAEIINTLGFDALSFSQSHHFTDLKDPRFLPTSLKAAFGLKGFPEIWTADVQKQIDDLPAERPLIFFSFSSPSLTVPWIMENNPGRVKAWVTDGGPFFSFIECFHNYFRRYLKIENPLLRYPILASTIFSWNAWELESRSTRQIANIPEGFPVLSFRGLKDPLVPQRCIDDVFKNHSQLDMKIVELKNTGHLNGLFMEKDCYVSELSRFLLGLFR